MRTKTEQKRLQLLSAATEVFFEQGYERTLMSHVSERAKCSKGTLYSYFESKEELYYEVIIAATAQETGGVLEQLDASAECIENLLFAFGVRLLQTVYSSRFQALRRLVFSTPADSKLGATIYARTVKPYMDLTTQFLASAMERGQLRRDDPEVAAAHLCGLLESELLLKFLLHALDNVPPTQLESIARRAMKAFVAAYHA